MKRLGRAIELLSYGGCCISGFLLTATMVIVMVEVVSRFILRRPIIFSEEFSGYFLVAIVFLGLAQTWKDRGHIRITFVIERLPAKITNWLRMITLIVALLYVGLATMVSYPYVISSLERNIRSDTPIMTKLGYPQMAIPIGFTILLLMLIVEIVRVTRSAKAGRDVEKWQKY